MHWDVLASRIRASAVQPDQLLLQPELRDPNEDKRIELGPFEAFVLGLLLMGCGRASTRGSSVRSG